MRIYSETVPVQYEEGRTHFCGMDILVDERVFIPRPETELVVSTVIDLCQKKSLKDPFILDVCTGSGAISIALAKHVPSSRVIAVDISEDALQVARANAVRAGVEKSITFFRSDMFGALCPDYKGMFDAVVSNPPYVSAGDYQKADAWVKAEPEIALLAGDEGMDHLNILAERSGDFLKAGGFLAVEIGYDQSEKVKRAFLSAGYENISPHKDFNGYERVITGEKPQRKEIY